MEQRIKKAISAGLYALSEMQTADGSFPLLTGARSKSWLFRARSSAIKWRPCGPLFSTAYIMLEAGRLLPAGNIARALDYIRRHRRPDGLWEYDPAIGIPPDADSTACSLAALALNGYADEVADGPDLLRTYWRGGSGPFQSWRAGGMWSLPERDDAVVNCNVLLALQALGSPASAGELAAVIRLIQNSVQGSRYYCSPSTIVHAARRGGLDVNMLPPTIAARPEAADHLAISQWLCGTEKPDAELLERLLAAQDADGAWGILPWVTGVGTPKPYWGSAAICTALAIQALSLQQRPVGMG